MSHDDSSLLRWWNIFTIKFLSQCPVLLNAHIGLDSLFKDIFCLKGRFPSLPWDVLHYFTMILQRIRIIVVAVGFAPGSSAPEVCYASN